MKGGLGDKGASEALARRLEEEKRAPQARLGRHMTGFVELQTQSCLQTSQDNAMWSCIVWGML